MKFFIGTTNSNKVQEIVSILHAVGCELEVTPPINPEETEDDFEGNAILKARVYAAHTGGLTISEDSGLVIPHLNGLPGPWSSRFCECKLDKSGSRVVESIQSNLTRDERDKKNNQLVLDMMKGVELPYRAAFFKVVLVVARSDGTILFKASNEAYGWIAEEARGSYGFGYDPIFVGGDTFGKTYAELDPMRKNLRSHRNKVLSEFKAWLGQYLKKSE